MARKKNPTGDTNNYDTAEGMTNTIHKQIRDREQKKYNNRGGTQKTTPGFGFWYKHCTGHIVVEGIGGTRPLDEAIAGHTRGVGVEVVVMQACVVSAGTLHDAAIGPWCWPFMAIK